MIPTQIRRPRPRTPSDLTTRHWVVDSLLCVTGASLLFIAAMRVLLGVSL